MKHSVNQISNKFVVVLTFILGLYLCKAAVHTLSFHFELNGHQWKSTPSRLNNYPPRVVDFCHVGGAMTPQILEWTRPTMSPHHQRLNAALSLRHQVPGATKASLADALSKIEHP